MGMTVGPVFFLWNPGVFGHQAGYRDGELSREAPFAVTGQYKQIRSNCFSGRHGLQENCRSLQKPNKQNERKEMWDTSRKPQNMNVW